MDEFPPPRSRSAEPGDAADAARAARLAALSARTTAARTTAATTATPTYDGPANVARRRHPAKGARVAALGLSLASTGGLATLFALTGTASGTQVQAAQVIATNQIVATDSPEPTTTSPATTPQATADVVVNGAVFNNKWGDVQVQATFASNGSLVDVVTLQTPSRDGKSVRINDQAVPRLNSEALTIQSADVDTVSGATYTSNDYRRSLQSAIDAAAGAGLPVATA